MLTFGTDGVRGEFGKELTETYAANLAEVAAQILQCKKVVIGRDTRESGSALENAIAEALTRIGSEVQLMGVAPTPAIAFAAHKHGVVAIAITASHNLFQDNGIKIFAAGGLKLSDDQQASIEREMIARDTAAQANMDTIFLNDNALTWCKLETPNRWDITESILPTNRLKVVLGDVGETQGLANGASTPFGFNVWLEILER
jgi:phosphomannomutase